MSVGGAGVGVQSEQRGREREFECQLPVHGRHLVPGKPAITSTPLPANSKTLKKPFKDLEGPKKTYKYLKRPKNIKKIPENDL